MSPEFEDDFSPRLAPRNRGPLHEEGAKEAQERIYTHSTAVVGKAPVIATSRVDHGSSYGPPDPNGNEDDCSPRSFFRIMASLGLRVPPGQLEEDIALDNAIQAKLTQTVMNPAAWNGMSDAFKEAVIATCMKDQAWKKEFGHMLLGDETKTLEKVVHHSSSSHAAYQSPVHSAHSAFASSMRSDAENVQDMASLDTACRHRAMSKPQYAVQQPPAPPRHPMVYVPSHVTQTAEAPTGVLTRSDINKFKELEIQ
ncbi:hypothetical protein ACKKBF_B12500 [Auxenochlorella protothecoides x Auxenochlorella symbiontica]